jgi:gamma-glutamyltranspeptidase/glutathione hydrolase
LQPAPLHKLSYSAVSLRPTVTGKSHAVACGHYLAALAAMRVLDRGGNAVDAGVTGAMALAVLQPDIVSFAGVAPTLIYLRSENRVISLAGLGYWPAATDVERLRAEGGGTVPEGLLRTVLPAAPATHIEALRRFGTISFEEAATPALELARDGFVVYPLLAANLATREAAYSRWPDSQRIFVPHGRAPAAGEVFHQADLARVIAGMIEAERASAGSREQKLRATHEYFYRGPVAQAIADYHARNRGFVTREDLAGFEVPVEHSISARYREYDVHACDVWCQGVTLLEALKIVEGFDLGAAGHNTAGYLHRIAEALNLAFADREAYVGDPAFVRVPTSAMLSEAYCARQRARISESRAFGQMPEPGDLGGADAAPRPMVRPAYARARGATGMSLDTIYCGVMDRDGNAYSATLSDNTQDTPVIPGTGLAISSRGSQSRLTPGHPAEVKPGKRPRLTPSPALALRDGRPYMVFGTPGGDVQSQAMLQVFLNVVEFGISAQQAVEAPRVYSASFPDSFAPHDYYPGRLSLDGHMPAGIAEALQSLGHDVEQWPPFPAAGGAVCAVVRDPATGRLHAGADPRREAYAIAW